MWQDIIALSIVAVAVGVTIYRVVRSVGRRLSIKAGHCGSNCGCGQ